MRTTGVDLSAAWHITQGIGLRPATLMIDQVTFKTPLRVISRLR